MKLYDCFTRKLTPRGFHSTIVTTFGVEFTAFEQVLAPQFFGAGAGNIVLLADSGMVSLALADGGALPAKAGEDYVVHTPPHGSGVFHPKIVFQVGRDGARIVVGSANATSAGIAGNREVVTQVECTGAPSPERAFAVAVWNYLADLVEEEQGPVRDAFTWLEARTPWLADAQDVPPERSWTLADGSKLAFIANEARQELSIIDRFAFEVDDTRIDQLVVISPYWDDGLLALRALIQTLKPGHTVVLIQTGRQRFPVEALGDLDVEVKELVPGEASPAERFSHAKLVIATGGGFDHVLSGSANCTIAAMGLPGRKGQNAEACLYRRVPEGTVVSDLKLDKALSGPALAASDIPPLAVEAPLPLEDPAARSPGSFEMEFNRLTWRPATGLDPMNVTIELLKEPELEPVGRIAPTAWRASDGSLTSTIDGAGEGAKFARASGPNGNSGVAIIAHKEGLRLRRRERNALSVDRVTSALPEIGALDMRLLSLLDLLERADKEEQTALAIPRRLGPKGRSSAEAELPVQLGYEAFLRVRTPPPEGQGHGGVGARNALAGSSVDVMRSFLSDLVSGGERPSYEGLLEEDQVREGNEAGVANGGAPTRRSPAGASANRAESHRSRVIFDAHQIEKAVADYRKTVLAQAGAGAIGANHVFRLRLWLLLLLGHRDRLACDETETGWPRLIVRVLAAFFVGQDAPIKKLAIDPRYQELPIDMIEAWVTVLFALGELAAAMALLPDESKFAPHVERLGKDVRSLIGITEADLASPAADDARRVLDRLLELAPGD